MANNTVTTANDALKSIYRGTKLETVTLDNNPWLGMIPKREDFGGKDLPLPILYSAGQGRSATFSDAQANATAAKIDQFLLTRVKDYQVDIIDGELLEAAESDMEAFINARVAIIDQGLQNIANNLSLMLYGNGGGSRGRVGSVSTVTLTLLDIESVVNFEVGMSLVSCDTDGTSGSVDTDVSVVTGVDRSLGKLVEAGTWTTGSVFQDNDYIFCEGDFGVMVKGLAAWVPSSAPGATSFFGVDRTSDSRLGGLRYDGSGLPIEEALMQGLNLAFKAGAKTDVILMHPTNFTSLAVALGSKVQYSKVPAQSGKGEIATIGFESIKIHGPSGKMVDVVADPRCTYNVAYALQKNTWTLATMGKAPRLLDKDGMVLRAVYNDDAYEVRMGYKGQVGCTAPGNNCRIALA